MNWFKFLLVVTVIVGVLCIVGAICSFISHAAHVVGLVNAALMCVAEMPWHERIPLEREALRESVQIRCDCLHLSPFEASHAIDLALALHANGASTAKARTEAVRCAETIARERQP